MAEPIERLEKILLDDSKPDRITRIGTLTNLMVHHSQLFSKITRMYLSHEDMQGIDPSVMVHRLNVSPSFPPICQKKQVFAPKQDRAIAEEVRKLLEVDFIRKVYYLDWLANVVMFKRANRK